MSERKVDWFGRKDWGELQKAYETLAKAANFKVGDKVRILRKADNWELGWGTVWYPSMNKLVGKVVEIHEVFSNGNVVADGFVFPWFVLELVEPVLEKHIITIDGKSTEVSEEAYNEIKRLFN
jgi:hypothetical protein